MTDLLPGALEVRIDPEFPTPVTGSRPASGPGVERSPLELFREYCATHHTHDPRLDVLFAHLHDRVSGGA